MIAPCRPRTRSFGRFVVAGLAAAAALFTAAVTPAEAGDAAAAPLRPLGAEERQQIEAVVRDYIMKNPDVLVEALTAYQARKEEAKSQEARSNLATYRSDITSDPATPFSGNPSGDVTVVEFFDYNCGYCKRMVPAIQELLQSDGKVRYVFKEFPILGPQSLVASKAALAVWKLAPEKHFAFHVALMGARGELSEERILGMAEKIGIDGARLRTAMEDPAIEQQIRRNLELGRLLDISGTPGFVIGERIVPGAIDLDTMRSMIADARGK